MTMTSRPDTERDSDAGRRVDTSRVVLFLLVLVASEVFATGKLHQAVISYTRWRRQDLVRRGVRTKAPD